MAKVFDVSASESQETYVLKISNVLQSDSSIDFENGPEVRHATENDGPEKYAFILTHAEVEDLARKTLNALTPKIRLKNS